MADKIRINPDELMAQGAALEALSKRMEAVQRSIGIIGSDAWNATSGGVGITHNLLAKRVDAAASTIQVGANLAREAAQSFRNVDAVIRGRIESGEDNNFTRYLRDTVPESVRKQPVSQQKVSGACYGKWEHMANSPVGTKQNDIDFGQGADWGGNYQYSYNDVVIDGFGCYAMAHMMSVNEEGATGWNVAHGSYPPPYSYGDQMGDGVDPGVIQPGDVLLYYRTTPDGTVKTVIGSDGEKYPDQHWVYVYDVQGDTMYIGEGNAWDGSATERVNYRTYDLNRFGSGKERRVVALKRAA